jgi:hypothetical protein
VSLLRGTGWVFDIIQVKLHLQRLNKTTINPATTIITIMPKPRNATSQPWHVRSYIATDPTVNGLQSKVKPLPVVVIYSARTQFMAGRCHSSHSQDIKHGQLNPTQSILSVTASSFRKVRRRTQNMTSVDFSIPAPPQCALTHSAIYTLGGY